jgi:hypothetical protein
VHIHIVGWCTVHIHIVGWCTVHIHIVGWCTVHIHIVGWCTVHKTSNWIQPRFNNLVKKPITDTFQLTSWWTVHKYLKFGLDCKYLAQVSEKSAATSFWVGERKKLFKKKRRHPFPSKHCYYAQGHVIFETSNRGRIFHLNFEANFYILFTDFLRDQVCLRLLDTRTSDR